MPSVIVNQGSLLTLPTPSFTKENHTFSGWNTQANGTRRSYILSRDYVL